MGAVADSPAEAKFTRHVVRYGTTASGIRNFEAEVWNANTIVIGGLQSVQYDFDVYASDGWSESGPRTVVVTI